MAEYTIKKWALLLAIIFALLIEYYLIVIETFVNFQTAYGNWGGFFIYFIVTAFSLIFLKLAFRRVENVRFIQTFIYAMFIVIPIGIGWGMFQGYVSDQLFSPEWQFTHDFVYVAIISQFVVLALLLLGTREVECITDGSEDGEIKTEFEPAESDVEGW